MTEQAALSELKQKFADVAGEDLLINQQELQEALGIQDNFFAAKLFSLFDEDGNGTVEYDEFINHVEMLVHGTEEDKLRFAFQLHDIDGNGTIDQSELHHIIESSLVENKLDFSPSQVESLAGAMFHEADADGSGVIDFEEFKRHPERVTHQTSNLRADTRACLPPSTP